MPRDSFVCSNCSKRFTTDYLLSTLCTPCGGINDNVKNAEKATVQLAQVIDIADYKK